MSTISGLTGQIPGTQQRPTTGERNSTPIGGQPPSQVRQQAEDSVSLSTQGPRPGADEVSGEQAAAGIGGNAAAAAGAHQIPAELMSILDELDSLGV